MCIVVRTPQLVLPAVEYLVVYLYVLCQNKSTSAPAAIQFAAAVYAERFCNF